ncbi:MAG: hypothetical protein Q3M24_06750 [Candidatus Electrothrix aestuarii]|uniref:AlgX/AlgJ SGNH hydrolase-like domain-containing protein n=1 Tax=Candidatus Electrothrix aestuarii TaxID=3062594 RepID=A0AAU8LYY0_9BACT|nr:hypothetical protein [Candidatus Electrothrix aestuarii]
MKKFIINSSIFVLPFIILFALNIILYNQQEGDLIRLGYLYSNPSPKSKINSQYDLSKRYERLSEIDLTTNRKFKVITIGDSFSEQGSLGYKNFLANKGVSVLHIDRFISGSNPNQTLIQLLNSNVFDHISADYVVLQSVERSFNQRNKKIDFNMIIDIDSITNKIKKYNKKLPDYNLKFFSEATLKIPLTNIQYLFHPKPYYSKTYKYKTNSNNLFSNVSGELLFYQDDINNLNKKNDLLSIHESIEVLQNINNLAAKRRMKLIVLVSPDKYDLYYKFIENNDSLPKPLFFPFYEQTEKEYKNVDSYKILSEKIIKVRDVYFYDDTHWSPKGSKIIADEIYDIINE